MRMPDMCFPRVHTHLAVRRISDGQLLFLIPLSSGHHVEISTCLPSSGGHGHVMDARLRPFALARGVISEISPWRAGKSLEPW